MSSLGRIKTVDRITKPDKSHPNGQKIKGQIISTKNSSHRYESFIMRPQNKRLYVHRLVAEYFIGEIPDGYEINHINGDTKDNRVKNLEIVTHKENMRHATNCLGRWKTQAKRQNKRVFCVELNMGFESIKEASEFLGNYSNKGGGISHAIRCKCKALGFHWKFIN